MAVATHLLIERPDVVEPLVGLLETEWPDWYNWRGASARAELSERIRRDGLPLGIVAFEGGELAGTCALTASSGGLVTERSPWLGGLVVMPQMRRRGIAAALLGRARAEARRLGHTRIYALTARANTLFIREDWSLSEVIDLNQEPHSIFATTT
jgi:predicted N-acetyltransferase YhbS